MFNRTTVSGFYTYPSDQLCKVQIAKHMRKKIAIVAPFVSLSHKKATAVHGASNFYTQCCETNFFASSVGGAMKEHASRLKENDKLK